MTAPALPVFDRLAEVLASARCGHSKLYEQITKGLWPPAVRLGATSVWPRHETAAILNARIAGWSDQQIRELVLNIMELRAKGAPSGSDDTRAA